MSLTPTRGDRPRIGHARPRPGAPPDPATSPRPTGRPGPTRKSSRPKSTLRDGPTTSPASGSRSRRASTRSGPSPSRRETDMSTFASPKRLACRFGITPFEVRTILHTQGVPIRHRRGGPLVELAAFRRAWDDQARRPLFSGVRLVKAENGHIDAGQRFRGDRRCPICGGSEDDPRPGPAVYRVPELGRRIRPLLCAGIRGLAPLNPGSQCYPHRRQGRCRPAAPSMPRACVHRAGCPPDSGRRRAPRESNGQALPDGRGCLPFAPEWPADGDLGVPR